MSISKPIVLIALLLISCGDKYSYEHYDSGELKSYGIERDGLKQGTWLTFFASGDTMFIQDYVDGKLNGIEKYYSYHKGGLKHSRISAIRKYVDDIEQGEFSTYYDDGSLFTEGHNLDGKNHGEWKQYYRNGKLQAEAIWELDNPKQLKTFYQNGVIESETQNYGNGESYHYDSLGNKTHILVRENYRVIDSTYYNAL